MTHRSIHCPLLHHAGILAAICLVFLFMTQGCAKKQITPPSDTVTASETAPPYDLTVRDSTEPEESAPEPDTVGILVEEARKFAELNQKKQALLVLNQALEHAGIDDMPDLIKQVEKIMMTIPAGDLEDLLAMSDLSIPRPAMLYWLGVNLSLEGNYGRAGEVLTDFCSEFPGHAYYADSRELLAVVKKALFQSDSIGCILPLTGRYSVFGHKALKGMELALHQLSVRYDRSFRLIVKDNRSDPDYAVTGVRELAESRVAGIAGPLLNAEDAGREAQKLKIPMIAMSQNHQFCRLGDFLFSNFITPELQVHALVSYAVMELGVKRFAVLYPDELYGKKYMNLFWDAVETFDGEIRASQPYDPEKTDFSTAIQKISGAYYPLPEALRPEHEISTDPLADHTVEGGAAEDSEAGGADIFREEPALDFDALFIPDSVRKINMILPQLAYNDITDIYLLGTNLWHNPLLIEETEGYNRHAVIVDGFLPGSRNPLVKKFTADFKSVYGYTPGYIEAIAYDTAAIFFTLLDDETIDSQESLKHALLGSRVFEGVTGKTIFDTSGDVHKELFLITVKNQQFVEITQ